jgi:hypothetical protein
MADDKPQNGPLSGWRDQAAGDYGGWPELYRRLDALRLRISRLGTDVKTKPTPTGAKPKVADQP